MITLLNPTERDLPNRYNLLLDAYTLDEFVADLTLLWESGSLRSISVKYSSVNLFQGIAIVDKNFDLDLLEK